VLIHILIWKFTDAQVVNFQLFICSEGSVFLLQMQFYSQVRLTGFVICYISDEEEARCVMSPAWETTFGHPSPQILNPKKGAVRGLEVGVWVESISSRNRKGLSNNLKSPEKRNPKKLLSDL